MFDPSTLRFGENGLIPVIAQAADTGEVLMLAWMNRESLQLTLNEGRAVYWSRSRQALWRKGEQSGHVQQLRELRIDCDGDTVLMQVEQLGGIACHTGRRRCFYRKRADGDWQVTDEVLQSPDTIYGKRQ